MLTGTEVHEMEYNGHGTWNKSIPGE